MDRTVLLEKAAKRIVDSAVETTEKNASVAKSAALAEGRRTTSSATTVAIENAYIEGYQQACIAVMEKIQLEDRDNALSTAEDLRKKLLEPAVKRFSALAAEDMLNFKPANALPMDARSLEWFRVVKHTEAKLRDVQGNVVEEFQLAITRQSPQKRQQVHIGIFVDQERIEALRAKSSIAWDFTRLVALCEELNTCWLYGAHHAVAMLSRAVIDHVPPVFGQTNFSGVANQYAGGKSFGDVMKQLDKTTKAIADGHLHSQIRQRESVPTSTQVDCRQSIDALLAELIRITP